MFLWGLFVAVVAFPMALLLWQIRLLPRPSQVKAAYRSSNLVVFDRRGLVIDEVLGPASSKPSNLRHMQWVSLNRVPAFFAEALVRAEDQRFYYHPGLDPVAKARALFERWSGRQESPAASLSEQLIEMLRPGEFSGWRRGLAAVALEMSWRKRDILEAYMNLVSYRQGLQGVAAAAYSVFDKSPAQLSRAEAALLVVSAGAPNSALASLRTRTCWLLRDLRAGDDCRQVDPSHLARLEESFRVRPYVSLAPEIAAQLATRQELRERPFVRSTLDRALQYSVHQALQRQIAAVEAEGLGFGAAVVLENSTGNVLAYANSAQVAKMRLDAVTLPRPAGAAILMPLLYGRAFEEHVLTAATLLENPALALLAPGSHRAQAPFVQIPARVALAASMNLPAQRALEWLGVDTFVGTLSKLGLTTLRAAGDYDLFQALRSPEVRLLELANAYRAVANDGLWSPLRYARDLTTDQAPRRVFSEGTAFLLKDILADREAAAAAFGRDPAMATPYWSAVKSGAGTDRHDFWSVGFSEKYTVAVWIGDFTGTSEWNASDTRGSLPVWREILDALHAQEPSEPPHPPEELKRVAEEWFLPGTDPEAMAGRSRFSYPVSGLILDMDTEVRRKGPPLMIMITAPQPDQNVYVNGRRLGKAQPYLPWTVQPGPVTLELRDSFGRILDKVQFKVRGGRVAMAERPNNA